MYTHYTVCEYEDWQKKEKEKMKAKDMQLSEEET